ncbi:hypothetical protein C8Q79DRAFT_762004 [Trametes meyenii]|nr:hypothetical protein C8Q79DRAFT_762004 [Trametes meyenii]
MTGPPSTPRYPGAPNLTPRSTQKALRPPIYNPYDKFTQPEFDAWIGDITGALKRALGREELPPPAAGVHSPPAEEEAVEDSFAEVKARRLAKGKERARDEDFEEEEPHQESEEEEQNGWGDAFDGEEYSSEDSGETEEEIPHNGHGKEAEVIELLSDDEDAEGDVQEDADEGEEEYDEERDEAIADYGEDAEGSEAGSDDDQGLSRSSPAAGPSGVVNSSNHEVTEMTDSDEEPEEAEGPEETEEQVERRALPARFQRKPDIVASVRQPSQDVDMLEDDADKEQIEEEETPFPPHSEENELVDIDDPWRGPATYAEDFYAGGDARANEIEHGDPHNFPGEEFDNEDELVGDEPTQPADLPDPWDGPRNFAEDFYAGGDVLPTIAEGITPSHLTPKDEDPLFIPGISSAPEETRQDSHEPTSPHIHDVDELYADDNEGILEAADPETPFVDAANVEDEEEDENASEDERSPSPPSAILRSHVDWNWPPAFPGRVATSSGHVESEREIFEISDDEEDDPATILPPVVEQSVQPEVEIAAEEQEDLQPLSVDIEGDASGLYAEFDDLYDMGPEAASFNIQSSYEPISPPGLDFGDLPIPTHRYSGVEANGDVPELDVDEALVSPESQDVAGFVVDAVLKAASNEVEPEEILSDLIAVDDNVPPTVPEVRMPSVGVEEVLGREDQEGPRAPEVDCAPITEPTELEVEIFEVDDEDDIRSSVPPTDDIDISSVSGDVEVSVVEYVVEEVMTEGRLTEEPELAHDVDVGAPPREGSVDSVASSRQTNPTRNVTPAATSDVAAESTASLPEAPLVASTNVPAPVPLGRTLSSHDFPPPVSANPNVPDPASLTHTPVSPASPDGQPASEQSSPAAETRDATSLPMNAALHPLFRKLGSITHSPSGLFTPLTAGNSAPVTPEKAPSEDGTGEKGEAQPNAEDMVVPTDEPAPSVEVDDIVPEGGAVESTKEASMPTEETSEPVHDGAEPVAEQPTAVSADVKDELPTNLAVEPGPKKYFVEEAATQPVENGYLGDFGVEAHGLVAGERQPTPESDADADAEGEVDPEYIPPEADTTTGTPGSVSETVAVPEELQSPNLNEVVDTNGSGPVPETVPETEESTIRDATEDAASASSPGPNAAEVEDGVRPLKRKRRSLPPSRIPRLTRSRTSKSDTSLTRAEAKTAKPKKGKGKGKQRAHAESDEEDNVSVAHSHASGSTSGGSSAAAAQNMLVSNSRGTSRASSVASNAPSAYSGLSMPSPTVDRILPSNGHHNPPPPFIHNHGILHHHHGRPMAPVVPIASRRQPSEPPVRQGVLSQRGSTEPGPSSQQPVRAPAASSTSSPVTRSNCRFHTISIPKSDEGPRILFAVPGCSLGDGELIKDEEIEDQGLVKAEDIPRLIRDVESLDLPHYLISVLRQLVSVDMLREGEVFYIPTPGDGIALGKQKSRRAKLKQRESISARTWSNGGASRSKESSSIAPPSQASVSTSASSASYAGKPSKKGGIATPTSFSDSELSDLEDEEEPPFKRAKDSHPDIDVQAQLAEQPPPKTTTDEPISPTPAESESASVASTAVSKARKLQPRRSRRLGVDAAAYKPEADVSDGSEEEEEGDSKKRRKRGPKKGIKRTRTEETGDIPAEGSSDKSKRRRVRTSTSNGDKPAADATEAAS